MRVSTNAHTFCPKKDSIMKIRLISGAVYITVLVIAYCLKIFVHDFCFDALIYAFALIGTFEMLRAMGERITKAEKGIVFAFSVVCIPVCAVCEYFYNYGLHVTAVGFFVLVLALLTLFVFRHNETTLENLGVSLLSAVYPTILLSLMVLANHMGDKIPQELVAFGLDSRIVVLIIFVVSPCADSIAYLFGRFFKKYFPAKMAPDISPNKTVIGGIGGLIGGMLGAAALYFIYNALAGTFAQMHIWLPVYLGIGLVVSAATEFGDLVESGIKRKAGIKDMGNIMPGHGGILDRIDGSLFAAVVAYQIFELIYLIV